MKKVSIFVMVFSFSLFFGGKAFSQNALLIRPSDLRLVPDFGTVSPDSSKNASSETQPLPHPRFLHLPQVSKKSKVIIYI